MVNKGFTKITKKFFYKEGVLRKKKNYKIIRTGSDEIVAKIKNSFRKFERNARYFEINQFKGACHEKTNH